MSQTTTSPSVASKNGAHHIGVGVGVGGGGGGGSVTSIVRDHNNHHRGGDFHSDKNTLITSLNYNLSHVANNNGNNGNGNGNSSSGTNGTTATTSAGHHTYQNVSQFKQIQSMLQSTLNGGGGGGGNNGTAGTASNGNGHHHHNSHHHHATYHPGTANKVTAPSVPPPLPNTTPTSIAAMKAAAQAAATNGAGGGVSSSPSVAATNGNGASLNTTTTLSPVLAKTKTLDGYVGFANLPNQVYRKAVKKGFEFNLMVIGESGLGKSTFVNSLFLAELYNPADFPGTFARRKKTTAIDSTAVTLTEKGVSLRLAVIDTPGFGESIDNSNCWQPIVDYIDNKYEEFLIAESKINRELPIPDHRVHCCLHFIAPGHTLKQLDIEVMKKLHDRVNLIPIIAKADTMTPDEVKQFKANVLSVINEHKLQIYEFPDLDDDDVETNRNNSVLKSKLPFAIVGSNTTIDGPDGKTFRGRQYPWGCVNVDDLAHCDFMALRTMLIRTHMQDLKDVTNNVHYENYRFKKLAYVTGDKLRPTNKNPFQQLEDERKEADARLEKTKGEMEGVFDHKVKEKIARLKESEANLEKQQEQMKLSLEKEERELEEKRVLFLKEKQLWEDSNKDEEDRMRLSLEKETDKKKKKIF